jgi:hypothetical protein
VEGGRLEPQLEGRTGVIAASVSAQDEAVDVGSSPEIDCRPQALESPATAQVIPGRGGLERQGQTRHAPAASRQPPQARLSITPERPRRTRQVDLGRRLIERQPGQADGARAHATSKSQRSVEASRDPEIGAQQAARGSRQARSDSPIRELFGPKRGGHLQRERARQVDAALCP